MSYDAGMGAIRPWHVLVLGCACTVMVLILASIALGIILSRRRR
jgi:hypothetical protein